MSKGKSGGGGGEHSSIGDWLRQLLKHAGEDGDRINGLAFTAFVDYLVQHPVAGLPIAVGENGASGATSSLFWAYTAKGGLHLEAKAGFLSTATGNGGFSLDVNPDGTWRLAFAGSTVRIGYSGPDDPGHGNGHGKGHDDAPAAPTGPTPPPGNQVVGIADKVLKVFDGSAGHLTVDGTMAPGGVGTPIVGNDTIFAGVHDYLIGGTAPHTIGARGVPAGNIGNCVIYTAAANSTVPAGSVLADMQNARGYGSNAEGNQFYNIDQVRGSVQSNVLVGAAAGSDLKSGGANSVLISTGGTDYELRPDGTGNVLVSTVGSDRVLFDPNRRAWAPGDQTTMLGFRAGNSAWLDLSLLHNNFRTPEAAGYNPITGMGDINAYVKLVEAADGQRVLYSATGDVNVTYVNLIDLKLTHGLTAQGLFDSHGLVM